MCVQLQTIHRKYSLKPNFSCSFETRRDKNILNTKQFCIVKSFDLICNTTQFAFLRILGYLIIFKFDQLLNYKLKDKLSKWDFVWNVTLLFGNNFNPYKIPCTKSTKRTHGSSISPSGYTTPTQGKNRMKSHILDVLATLETREPK